MDNVHEKNPADNFGNTPLHFAALHGLLESCRLILDNVQNKNSLNSFGTTPLDEARYYNHTHVVQLFQEYMQRSATGGKEK